VKNGKIDWPAVAGLALLGYGLGKGSALLAVGGGALVAWRFWKRKGCCASSAPSSGPTATSLPDLKATTILSTGGINAGGTTNTGPAGLGPGNLVIN
jgi:hypothetical protein